MNKTIRQQYRKNSKKSLCKSKTAKKCKKIKGCKHVSGKKRSFCRKIKNKRYNKTKKIQGGARNLGNNINTLICHNKNTGEISTVEVAGDDCSWDTRYESNDYETLGSSDQVSKFIPKVENEIKVLSTTLDKKKNLLVNLNQLK